MNATIKSCSTGGVDIFVSGQHWTWCPTYDVAAEECNKMGYKIHG